MALMTFLPLLLVAGSPEAEALGKRLAEAGTLATLLPMVAQKEAEEMIADIPDLTDAEKQMLRDISAETARAGLDQVTTQMGAVYAQKMTVAEMRAIVAFNDSPAAQKHRALQPEVIAASVAALGPVDHKGSTLKAFCAKTGKGCAAK